VTSTAHHATITGRADVGVLIDRDQRLGPRWTVGISFVPGQLIWADATAVDQPWVW
jgi:hypothetical protein